MASQFDVCRTVSGSLVVVIQSDLLADLRTRVVVFLASNRPISESMGHLTPRLVLNGNSYTLEAHTIATLTLDELAENVGSLATERDKIIRAIDALLAGV